MKPSRLEALVAPLVRPCSLLRVGKAPTLDSPAVASYFGGHPYAEAGEVWPACAKCREELSFICQVRFADTLYAPPEGLDLFTFYYCWACSPWGLDGEQPGQWEVRMHSNPRADRAVRIERRRMDRRATAPCSVGFTAAKSLPDWDGIEVCSPEASDLSSEANEEEPWEPYETVREKVLGIDRDAGADGAAPADGAAETDGAVGGYPSWIQAEATPECPRCRKRMEMFAQIGSVEAAGLMWGDYGCVYLFVCRAHPDEVRLELQCF